MEEGDLLQEGKVDALHEKRESPFAHVPFSKNEIWLLIGIVVVAMLLRVPTLGKFSFWFDELCTWKFSHVSSIPALIEGLKEDIHPPAYDILMWGVIHTMGDSEGIMRLPSAIFSLISIPALVMLGRRLFNSRAAFIAATFAALIPTTIYYGQEARSYAMTYFLAIATTICWVELYRQVFIENVPPSRKRIALLLGLTVVANYTHYYADLLTAMQGLIFFGFCIKYRRGYSIPIIVAVVSVVTLLPWAFFVKQQVANNIWWIQTTSWFNAAALYNQLLFGFWPALGVVGLALILLALPTHSEGFLKVKDKAQPIIVSFIWLALVVALWHFWDGLLLNYPDYTIAAAIALMVALPLGIPGLYPQTPSKRNTIILLFVWFLVPFLIVQAVSVKATPIYVNRYLHISVPAAYLLIGYGLSRLKMPALFQGLGAVAICVLSIYQINQMGFFANGFKEDWKGMTKWVVQETPAGAPTMLVGITERKGVYQYYFGKYGAGVLKVDVDISTKDDATVGWTQVLDQKPPFVWIVGAHLILNDPVEAGRMTLALAKDYGIAIKHNSFSGGQLQAILFIRKDLSSMVKRSDTTAPSP